MKKIATLLLIALLMFSMILLISCEKGEAGTPGLVFYLLPDGTYGVQMGTTQYLEEIEIPNFYKKAPVTQILGGAFSGATNLKSITIPSSVTSIGERAFSGCIGLTSVTIPSSVTSIGGSAFSGCTGLTSITIPGSVTSIGFAAFDECTSLTSITFEGTVAEWSTIELDIAWKMDAPITEVICSDGTVTLN